MESNDGSVQETADDISELESLNQRLDEFITKVDQLEQKLKDVQHFYPSANKKHPNTPEVGSMVGERMQELMHEFGTILHEITQHKCAEPFMHPVDVIGLGLHDYYEVVEKPMDFSTIKNKMEVKDDAGYKNVREICADVRLIFDNAMKYYKEMDDFYVMAKTLIDVFETRWLEFLPKVDEEEQRQKKEDAKMQQGIYLAEEAAFVKMVRDLDLEIDELDMELNEVSEVIYNKYWRQMTMDEKKKLKDAINQLSYEGFNKEIEFIAANDPNFQGTGETVEIDLDAQSNSTLWRLKFLVETRLQVQTSLPSSKGDDDSSSEGDDDEGNNLNNRDTGERVTCDDFTKD